MLFSPSDAVEIELLILPGSNLNQIAAVLDPMRAANRALGSAAFGWNISTPDGAAVMTTTGIPIPADQVFSPQSQTGPLFVIASYGIRDGNWHSIIRALKSAAASGRDMVGIETGSWLLAQAGVLDGYRATTHWEYFEDFETTFPEIAAVDERYVIEAQGARVTTGGSGPTLDLMLNIIRTRHGFSVAREVANMFIYDSAKIGLTPQLGSNSNWSTPVDVRVAEAISLMERHLEEILTIEQIADQLKITSRHLLNLFVRETGNTIIQYYGKLRLHQARRLLLETRISVGEIAFRCGYSSSSRFSQNYARLFNQKPSQTRTQPA